MHHTGIKTPFDDAAARAREDFNCTIQELKLTELTACTGAPPYFNCTIQELKQQLPVVALKRREFQLHHTGIKTGGAEIQKGKPERISIAPYRN